MDFERILSPFIGYWNWAQARGTAWGKVLAMGAPVAVVVVVLYALFGGSGDGSSLAPPEETPGGNVSIGTPPPDATQPSGSDGAATGATGAEPSATPETEPTAFTQIRYTVEAGDSPSLIAEKVGVPVDQRDAWIEEMLALNGVTATTLQVGQELILPPF